LFLANLRRLLIDSVRRLPAGRQEAFAKATYIIFREI